MLQGTVDDLTQQLEQMEGMTVHLFPSEPHYSVASLSGQLRALRKEVGQLAGEKAALEREISQLKAQVIIHTLTHTHTHTRTHLCINISHCTPPTLQNGGLQEQLAELESELAAKNDQLQSAQ